MFFRSFLKIVPFPIALFDFYTSNDVSEKIDNAFIAHAVVPFIQDFSASVNTIQVVLSPGRCARKRRVHSREVWEPHTSGFRRLWRTRGALYNWSS